MLFCGISQFDVFIIYNSVVHNLIMIFLTSDYPFASCVRFCQLTDTVCVTNFLLYCIIVLCGQVCADGSDVIHIVKFFMQHYYICLLKIEFN